MEFTHLGDKAAHIKNSFSKKDEEIKKGIDNAYELSFAQFTKTGKEIKNRLSVIKIQKQAEQSSMSGTMAALSAVLPTQPTETYSSYYYDLYKDKIPTLMCYPYEYCKSDSENPNANTPYRTYNTLASKIIDCCAVICMIDVYLDNLVDGKSYSLSAQDILKLGL